MKLFQLRSNLRSLPAFEMAESKEDATKVNAADLRRSVVDMIEVHERTVCEVARALGVSERTVTDLFIEAKNLDKQRAIRVAWDNGRRSTLPPVMAMRRAA